MLKSIAKEETSKLKLGKLKLNMADNSSKNIEKTIAYLKRNMPDDELTETHTLLNAVTEMLGYDESLMFDVQAFNNTDPEGKIINLGLGKNVEYEGFMEFRYADSNIRNIIYLDLLGKIPKAKNGNKYRWRTVQRGKFTAYDGKRLMACYKLLQEVTKDIDDEQEEKKLIDYFVRAHFLSWKSFQDYRIDNEILEVILNIYQDDISIQAMIDYEKAQSGEYAKAFMTKKNINKEVLERMENTVFLKNGFSFTEFDNDTDLEKLKQVEEEWLEVYKVLPKINNVNTDLRFRKLGKHKANGIYFPTQNCLAVDIRSVSSMIHEYGHLVDYELLDDIISLRPEFRDIIKNYSYEVDKLEKSSYVAKKKYYYTTPTEVFARAFELYVNQSVKTSFLKTEEEYNTLEEYTCFTNENLQKAYEFFDSILSK